MYRLSVKTNFSAAHHLQDYQGACQNLHGHNWKVGVKIICEKTDEIGLTIDYKVVKEFINEIMDRLDHQYLNKLKVFEEINPTSENIAKYIYKELEKNIKREGCKISEVEVWESDNTSMAYFE